MICRKDISVSRLEECGVCTGGGVKAGTTASTCSTCGGQGQVVTVQRTPIGAFQQVKTLMFTLFGSCVEYVQSKCCLSRAVCSEHYPVRSTDTAALTAM